MDFQWSALTPIVPANGLDVLPVDLGCATIALHWFLRLHKGKTLQTLCDPSNASRHVVMSNVSTTIFFESRVWEGPWEELAIFASRSKVERSLWQRAIAECLKKNAPPKKDTTSSQQVQAAGTSQSHSKVFSTLDRQPPATEIHRSMRSLTHKGKKQLPVSLFSLCYTQRQCMFWVLTDLMPSINAAILQNFCSTCGAHPSSLNRMVSGVKWRAFLPVPELKQGTHADFPI